MDIWVTARKFLHVSIWQVVILLINLFSMISFFPVGVFITAVEALVDTWKNSEWQNMFFPRAFFSKHPNASPSFTSKSKCFCVFFVSTDYSLSTTRIPILSRQFNISSHKRRQKWSFELEGNPPPTRCPGVDRNPRGWKLASCEELIGLNEICCLWMDQKSDR